MTTIVLNFHLCLGQLVLKLLQVFETVESRISHILVQIVGLKLLELVEFFNFFGSDVILFALCIIL